MKQPLLLLIETATEQCSVAISSGKDIIAKAVAIKVFDHSARLTLLIEQCLQTAGIFIDQMDAIALSEGPGSYTGLRVGMATAKGICFGTGMPLILVPTLEAMSNAAIRASGRQDVHYLPMLDARRMEVYAGLYNVALQQLHAPCAIVLEGDTFKEWKTEQKEVLYFGNGSDKWKLICSLEGFRHINVNMSAVDMVDSAHVRFESKEFSSINSAVPLYLKNPNITTPKPRLTH